MITIDIARSVAPASARVPSYRPGQECACCLGRHFHIGRSSAECAKCGAAFAIPDGVERNRGIEIEEFEPLPSAGRYKRPFLSLFRKAV